jgi:putative spermidine/putrescine transport system permease protein
MTETTVQEGVGSGSRRWARPRRARVGSSDTSASAAVGLGLSTPFLILIGVLVAYPLVKIVLLSTESPGFVKNFRAWVDLPANLTAVRVTFVDALIVTSITMVLGTTVAWSLVTTRSRFTRGILMASIILPLAMNTILKAFAFTVLFQGPGIVNKTLMYLHVIHSPLTLLYNEFSAIVGMVYWLYPYAALPLYVTFLSLDLDLLTVAESMGASRARALWDVALPLALPGIFATAVIDYVLSLGFFVIPVLLGGIAVPYVSTHIYDDVFQFYNLQGAAISSVVLLVAAFVVLSAGYFAVGRERLIKALG